MEAGCDEVGRGCLAGPVVAAAVILPITFKDPGLADSKTLGKKELRRLSQWIGQHALCYAFGQASPVEIDALNIQNASYLAMHRAVNELKIKPQHLLVDGNRFHPHGDFPHTCIVKGDGKMASIAAAAILAKIHRDQLMEQLDSKHPQYQWASNVGYPTRAHREGLRAHGTTIHHRKSFRLLPAQPTLFQK